MTKKRSGLGRLIRFIFKTIFVLALLIVIAIVGLWFYVDQAVIQGEAEAQIRAATDSLYTLSFDEIRPSLWPAGVSIKNLQVSPDKTVLQNLQNTRNAPRQHGSVKVSNLVISHFDIMRWINGEGIHFENFVLITPEISVTKEKTSRTITTADFSSDEGLSINDRIRARIPSLNLKSFVIKEANVTISDLNQPEKSSEKINRINLAILDIAIDSSKTITNERLLFARDIQLKIPDYERLTSDGRYKISLSNIAISSLRKNLSLKNIRVTALVPDSLFFQDQYPPRARINIDLPAVEISGINFNRLINNKQLEIDSLTASSAKIDVLKDVRLPLPDDYPKPLMPHEALAQVTQDFHIGKVILDGALIHFAKFEEGKSAAGVINFFDVNASISPLSNQVDSLNIQVETRLTESDKVSFHMMIPTESTQLSARYWGSVSNLSAGGLNAYLVPTASVEFGSGTFEQVDFNIQVQNGHASGTVGGIYRDVKMRILNEEGNRRRIISFLANAFVVKSDNLPDRNGNLRTGTVNNQHNPNDSFIRFVWINIRNGLFDLLGAGDRIPD